VEGKPSKSGVIIFLYHLGNASPNQVTRLCESSRIPFEAIHSVNRSTKGRYLTGLKRIGTGSVKNSLPSPRVSGLCRPEDSHRRGEQTWMEQQPLEITAGSFVSISPSSTGTIDR
jgi:hypothetical protein